MDLRNGSTPVPNRNPTSAQRFLGVLSQAPPGGNLSNSLTESSSRVGVQERDDSELDEDDVFWTGDFAVESNHRNHSTVPSSFSLNSRPHVHQHLSGFYQPEAFGILAALPENETGHSSLRNGSRFCHKTSFSSSSSSSSSSSRMIPSFPKPPLDRSSVPNSSFSLKYQSAPVNVPMLSRGEYKNCEFDEINDNDEEVDVALLPPHEIVARSLAHSPALACSVLEGAGRTLKGRDLRRVRNAVFRRTDRSCLHHTHYLMNEVINSSSNDLSIKLGIQTTVLKGINFVPSRDLNRSVKLIVHLLYLVGNWIIFRLLELNLRCPNSAIILKPLQFTIFWILASSFLMKRTNGSIFVLSSFNWEALNVYEEHLLQSTHNNH